jgi:hypothetical protein
VRADDELEVVGLEEPLDGRLAKHDRVACTPFNKSSAGEMKKAL